MNAHHFLNLINVTLSQHMVGDNKPGIYLVPRAGLRPPYCLLTLMSAETSHRRWPRIAEQHIQFTVTFYPGELPQPEHHRIIDMIQEMIEKPLNVPGKRIQLRCIEGVTALSDKALVLTYHALIQPR